MCKQYNVYNNRYCWGLRWPSGLHIGLSHRRWWLNPWLWPLCKHLFIELLKQWSLCLPTVNTVYLYLTTVYKRSADRGASIRGGIMSEWVVHMPWPLHYGHNMSRSVTMYSIAHRCWVAWEKDDRSRRASLCICIILYIRNCWPFVHLKWRKLIRGLHLQTNKQYILFSAWKAIGMKIIDSRFELIMLHFIAL